VSTTGGHPAGTQKAAAGVFGAGDPSNCLIIFCKLVRGMPSSPAISRCDFPAAKSLRNRFSSAVLTYRKFWGLWAVWLSFPEQYRTLFPSLSPRARPAYRMCYCRNWSWSSTACGSISSSSGMLAAVGGPVSTVVNAAQMIPLSGVVSVVNTPMAPRAGKNGRVNGTEIGGSITGSRTEKKRAISACEVSQAFQVAGSRVPTSNAKFSEPSGELASRLSVHGSPCRPG
jgi:hypothetical protein